MEYTLYYMSKYIERIENFLTYVSSSKTVDVAQSQRSLFQKYESNPVLHDAILGTQSIEESLEELSQVNKGIKKFLPWKKDTVHNERLKHMGQLVSQPQYLRTEGILSPDNLITMGGYITAGTFGVSALLSLWMAPDIGANPEEYQKTLHFVQVLYPTYMSLAIGPIAGMIATMRRFESLPTDQAKYLDGKVEEFYK